MELDIPRPIRPLPQNQSVFVQAKRNQGRANLKALGVELVRPIESEIY